MIEICNLRKQKLTQPYEVRVDRQSILGNPFYMKDESQRNEVCDKYQEYFYQKIKTSIAFICEVTVLQTLYKEHGELRLFCWCYPKRCHAETIRDYILNQLR